MPVRLVNRHGGSTRTVWNPPSTVGSGAISAEEPRALDTPLGVPEKDLVCHSWSFMWMGTAHVPRHPAGLPAVPRWGPAQNWRRLCLPAASDNSIPDAGRGHSARPGAGRSSQGQPTRSGTGFPSPPASNAPARDDMSPSARSAPARAVGPDHEWGTHTDRPLRRASATGPPPTTTGRPAARTSGPRTSGAGPAGVAAPVQARCSLSGGERSRHPPNAPIPQRPPVAPHPHDRRRAVLCTGHQRPSSPSRPYPTLRDLNPDRSQRAARRGCGENRRTRDNFRRLRVSAPDGRRRRSRSVFLSRGG